MSFILTLVGGLFAIVHSVTTLFWRKNKLAEIERTQRDVVEKTWRTDYLTKYQSKRSGKHPYNITKARETIEKYVSQTIDEMKLTYHKQIFLIPYAILITIWISVAYGMSQAGLGSQVSLLGNILGLALVPIFIHLILDLLATRFEFLSKIVCGQSSRAMSIVYLLLFVFVVSSFWFLIPSYFQIPLDILALVLPPASIILVSVLAALKLLGITVQNIANEFQENLENLARKLGDGMQSLVILQDSYFNTSESFSGIFKELDQQTSIDENGNLERILSDAGELIRRGEMLLKGEINQLSEREEIVRELRDILHYTMIDLKAWWISRYLEVSDKIGQDKELLQVSYALIDQDYWKWTRENGMDVTSNLKILKRAFRPRVTKIHSQLYYSSEVDTLVEIAANYAKRSITTDQPTLADIFTYVEKFEPYVVDVFRFFKLAEEIHEIEGNLQFSIQKKVSQLAKLLIAAGDVRPDWKLLSKAYTICVKSDLSAALVASCDPQAMAVFPDRAELVLECNKEGSKSKHLEIVYRRFIAQIMSSPANETLAKVVTGVLLKGKQSKARCEYSFFVCSRISAYLEIYQLAMQTRFSIQNNSGFSVIDYCDPLDDIVPRNEGIILLLAMIGECMYNVTFAQALAEALVIVENPDTWTDSTSILKDTTTKMDEKSKTEFLSVLLLEFVKGVHDNQLESIPKSTSLLINTVVDVINSSSIRYSLQLLPQAYMISKRLEAGLEWYNKISGSEWRKDLEKLQEISSMLDSFRVVLGEETSVHLLTLSYSLLVNDSLEDIIKIVNRLRETYGEDESVFALIRFLRNFTEHEGDPSIIEKTDRLLEFLLKNRLPLNLIGQPDGDSLLEGFRKLVISGFLDTFVALDEVESDFKNKGLENELYSAMRQKQNKSAERLEVLRRIISEGSRVIGYAASIFILPAWDHNTMTIDILKDSVSWKEKELDSLDITYKVVKSLFIQSCEGREDVDYVTFLLALITNTLLSQGWDTIDKVARSQLQQRDMALRWAHVFADRSNNGEDILKLPYSQLKGDMEARMKNMEDSDFVERDRRYIERLRLLLSGESVWRLKVRELDEDEINTRRLQVEVSELQSKLEKESTGRVNAEKLVRDLVLDTKIMDEGVMKYLSTRTFNYFLLSWNPYVHGKESKLKDIVENWITNHRENLGYPFPLGPATRVGKIPDGYSFEEFSEWVVEELDVLTTAEGIKPHMFIVRWAPSSYSARPLSNLESLEWDSITGLEEVFATTEERGRKIEQFIEGSVVSQLTINDSLAALRVSGQSLFEIWKDDLFQLRNKYWLLKEERDFVGKYEKELRKLVNSMMSACGANNLFELVLHDYNRLAEEKLDVVFKVGTRKKTKDIAKQIVTTLLDHLRLISKIALNRGENIK